MNDMAQIAMVGWAYGWVFGSLSFILWSHVLDDDNDCTI